MSAAPRNKTRSFNEKWLSTYPWLVQNEKTTAGPFFKGWGSSPALNFGEKLHCKFAKGEEKI
jgi:hypothetical protein